MRKRGFTLIELLIVVAIIAILAAIAIPNFLQAQVRAKVSRVVSEFRTVATGMESYFVDHNSYPHDYRCQTQNHPYNPTGLWALSTPIAYLTDPKFVDPFSTNVERPFGGFLYSYQALSDDHDMGFVSVQLGGNEQGNAYFGAPDPDDGLNKVANWWVIFSSGPDSQIQWPADYQPYGSPWMYDVIMRGEPDVMRNAIYDPTNGTVSFGNIYRAGGGTSNPVYGVIDASY